MLREIHQGMLKGIPQVFFGKNPNKLLVLISERIIDLLLLALLFRLGWQPLAGSPQGIIDGIPE